MRNAAHCIWFQSGAHALLKPHIAHDAAAKDNRIRVTNPYQIHNHTSQRMSTKRYRRVHNDIASVLASAI